MTKKLVIVCLFNFLIAALMGLLLRFANIYPLHINYRYLTHAHSHIAMLGWAYLMLYLLLVNYFVLEKKTIYTRLFWITQVAVWGMMFSFPFQGYAVVSITFSTLHILCSYVFIFVIWKQIKTKKRISEILLKTSLSFMALSTLGVWLLGPAVGLYGNTSDFYQIAIQFFLHFQFNGWFLFAVMGLFFHILGIKDSVECQVIYWTLLLATLFTFALPINWYFTHETLYWGNAFGVLLQVVAFILFLKIIKPTLHSMLSKASKLEIYLYSVSIFCLSIKVALQLTSLLPDFSQVIYQHRYFVIGFIHLLMLGTVTGFLFAFLMRNQLTRPSSSLSFGVFCFLAGFLLTEMLLFIQGYLYFAELPIMPHYNLFLFIASIFLPIGIALILYNLINSKNHVA